METIRLGSLGGSRLKAMNRAGIERSVLSPTSPGVQRDPEAALARRRASEANDGAGP